MITVYINISQQLQNNNIKNSKKDRIDHNSNIYPSV